MGQREELLPLATSLSSDHTQWGAWGRHLLSSGNHHAGNMNGTRSTQGKGSGA